jgi:hypothetical protein
VPALLPTTSLLKSDEQPILPATDAVVHTSAGMLNRRLMMRPVEGLMVTTCWLATRSRVPQGRALQLPTPSPRVVGVLGAAPP